MAAKSPPPCPNTVTVRRNPPRRARPTPTTSLPQNLHPPSSSKSKKSEITPFPIQDILLIEIPKNPEPEPHSSSSSTSESLKVYLRIRPLLPPKNNAVDQNTRSRHRNAWPQNPAAKKNGIKEKNTKKKCSEVCISVNDSQSVTLSPPAALQESRRIKSVVYEGFSHLFSADSSQNEVFEKMVKPLVEDFLRGKSGMLAALGPSGSGKTHTVFGTARAPGMVPLALQHIFKHAQGMSSMSKPSKSFSISIFEICSERGKAERIFDLSPDGAEVSMQQSTIKGLQEVAITDAAHAESLIASAMLKRATAMTNTNSQSSRSQCIINIHSLSNNCNRELDVLSNNAVLTIVDLAGAERERRTGNQGSRLVESNFINNTSMVFGMCLRSLLEHQKNPKKPLQKHFQNSLLTRYLKDYLEGKKRMALVLTVKPGEEDYLDTVYLLRQASPYMKIKFNNVDEQPNSVRHKRHIQSLSRAEEPKRKKYCGLQTHVIEEGKSIRDEHLLEEDAPSICKSDSVEIASQMPKSNDLTRDRHHQIMQNFAKAFWKSLKEYKKKLMVAEKEIESLNENLRSEKTKYNELQMKLEDFKSRCTCSKRNLVEATSVKVDTNIDAQVYLEGSGCSNVDEMLNTNSQCDNSPTMCNLSPGQDLDLFAEMNVNIRSPDNKVSDCSTINARCDLTPGWDRDLFLQVDVENHSPNLTASECHSTPKRDQEVASLMDENVPSPNLNECKCSSSPRYHQDISSQMDVSSHASQKASKCSSPSSQDQGFLSEEQKKSLDPPLSHNEDAAFIKQYNLDVPDCEIRSNTSFKSSNSKKPKRRLLPVSSILLRDITALGIDDEPEKSKGNKGGKRLGADERTQGSVSLLRLLQSNLRL